MKLMAENSGLQKILETGLFIYFDVCLGGVLCDAMCYGMWVMYMLISIGMYMCACVRACVCVRVYVRGKYKAFSSITVCVCVLTVSH